MPIYTCGNCSNGGSGACSRQPPFCAACCRHRALQDLVLCTRHTVSAALTQQIQQQLAQQQQQQPVQQPAVQPQAAPVPALQLQQQLQQPQAPAPPPQVLSAQQLADLVHQLQQRATRSPRRLHQHRLQSHNLQPHQFQLQLHRFLDQPWRPTLQLRWFRPPYLQPCRARSPWLQPCRRP